MVFDRQTQKGRSPRMNPRQDGWREVDGFPDVYADSQGLIMSKVSDRIIRSRTNQQGHLMLGLSVNGVQYTRSVALLVAKAFLPPPRNAAYNSVIHLNGDRSDCRAMNLMWRPRWFSLKYHQMFDQAPIRVKTYIRDTDQVFHSLREACTTYGLIEQATYIDMMNGTPCFHYGWLFERFE